MVLGTGLVLGTAVHLLHAYQMRQNASGLAREAERALARQELGKAANYLDRYLSFAPDDTDALAKYAEVLDKLAREVPGRGKALVHLEQALRRDPARRDLRRRAVSLALDLYRFRDALYHLQQLQSGAAASERGELEHLVGWCQDALGQGEEAAAAYRRALTYAPQRVSTYVLLAEVLGERLGRREEALQVMNELVRANPGSSEAQTARARFLQGGADSELANREKTRAAQTLAPLREAVLQNPSSSLAHFHLGMALLAAGEVEDAVEELQKASPAADLPAPQRRLFLNRLAEIFIQRRLFAAADKVVRQAEAQGFLDETLARFGAEAALGRRDRARAASLARRAVTVPTRDYRNLLWLAGLLEAAGEPYPAAETLRAATELDPGVPEVWAALAGVLARSRREDEAHAVLEEAEQQLPAQRRPLGLARCHEALGDKEGTEKQYRKCLESTPEDPAVLRAASAFFRHTDQPAKAEPLLRRLLASNRTPPDYLPRARRELALVLVAGGKDEHYEEALTLLARNRQSRGGSIEDECARAMVLASRPSQRGLALEVCEKALRGRPVSEENQFILAQLCEAAGTRQRARGFVLDLLATNPQNPQYASFHAKITQP
jgi:tetratricopeptide (TPR) repeat protein